MRRGGDDDCGGEDGCEAADSVRRGGIRCRTGWTASTPPRITPQRCRRRDAAIDAKDCTDRRGGGAWCDFQQSSAAETHQLLPLPLGPRGDGELQPTASLAGRCADGGSYFESEKRQSRRVRPWPRRTRPAGSVDSERLPSDGHQSARRPSASRQERLVTRTRALGAPPVGTPAGPARHWRWPR
jgi:hypothetical protein